VLYSYPVSFVERRGLFIFYEIWYTIKKGEEEKEFLKKIYTKNMNTEIRLERIAIIFVSLLGVAIIFLFIGKRSIEVITPVATPRATNQIVATNMEQSQENFADPNMYKNITYGFGAVFLAKAATATECSLDSHMAYDPIKEYVFADQPIRCALRSEDSMVVYNKQGGQLATIVFDLNKCRDAQTDQSEKGFCATYDTTTETAGKTAGKSWLASTWTKSGDFLTFYIDLTLGKNEHWKSDYKFLVLER